MSSSSSSTTASEKKKETQGPSRPTNYVSHRIRPGETLQDIARHYHGHDARWMDIYRLNTDVLSNPYVLEPGQVLSIPLFEDEM